MTSTDPPISASPICLAAICAQGPRTAAVLRELRAAGLTPAVYHWSAPASSVTFADLSKPETFARRLAADGMTDVVHIGGFGAGDVLSATAKGRFGFLRFLFGADGLEASYFRPYARALQDAGVRPRTLSYYLPGYGLQRGILTPNLAAPDAEEIQCLKTKTLAVLRGKPPRFGLRQAVVFEAGRPIGQEAHGTDALLRRMAWLPRRSGVRRILVKICPEGFPAELDAPTIGPRTVRRAHKAGVRLIVLDAEYGQIIDRERTLADAQALGVAVIGL